MANTHVSVAFVKVCPFAKYQSERDMPCLRPFRNGMSSVKQLEATERFDRTFAQCIALKNPHLVRHLREFKLQGQPDVKIKNNNHSIRRHLQLLEDTLMLHEWLKLKEIDMQDVEGLELSPACK